jgi:Tol biopolymer transport system component/tRNA A-37 threonylcarbamoyl transferase component Bud32
MEAGSRLGPYQILGPLGAGGMGEVYRARDPKLNRDVAIKVLHGSVADDRDRLARFAREAQALAALNHPNIATIYGIEDGAVQAIVMELVEGMTLAEVMRGGQDRTASGIGVARAGSQARPRRGPLALGEALEIARQIADALESAHGRGIVHRDLKPANVKITPDGAVKVLDFGLAKTAPSVTSSDVSSSPTFTAASAEGMIIGTAAYMSPEQAAGRPADTRADIWAFGVVLFEMLSGRQLFSGETAGHILAEVLKTDPAWETLPGTVPAEVRGLLERCLRKNARSRLRDIGDARIEIEDWLSRPEKTRFAAAAPERSSRSTLVPVAASLLVAAAAVGFAIWRRPAAGPAPTRTWDFALGDYENRFPDYDGPVISPDGTMIAFGGNGRGRLRVRDLDTLAPRELLGTDGAYQPFWSPDSASIGYYVAQASRLSVWKVSAHSGAPVKICDAPPGLLWPSAWRPDGVIVLSLVDGPQKGGLYTVSDRGGTPQPLTVGGSEDGDAVFSPVALPSGDLLYSRWRKGAYELVVTGKSGSRALVKDTAILTPLSFREGLILYSSGSGLWARAYDPQSATLAGEPLVVAPGGAFQSASLSHDGTLVYRTMTGGSQQLQWVDRAGVVFGPIGQAQEAIGDPAMSPDGSRIAATGSEGRVTSIWTHDIARGTRSRVTVGSGYQRQPSWAPGGDRLAFESNWDVFVQAADSAGQPQLVAGGSETQWSPTWSHDGRTLFFTQSGPTQNDIMFQTLGDGSAARVFLATPFNEYDARPSPDGRHVVYVSDESGRNEIYVREFPGGQGTKLISMRGGMAPRWSAKGDELFFVADDTLMAVSLKFEPRFSAGLPRPLFTAAKVGVDGSQGFGYDVAADGRFVVVRTLTRPERHGVVVEDWIANVKAAR